MSRDRSRPVSALLALLSVFALASTMAVIGVGPAYADDGDPGVIPILPDPPPPADPPPPSDPAPPPSDPAPPSSPSQHTQPQPAPTKSTHHKKASKKNQHHEAAPQQLPGSSAVAPPVAPAKVDAPTPQPKPKPAGPPSARKGEDPDPTLFRFATPQTPPSPSLVATPAAQAAPQDLATLTSADPRSPALPLWVPLSILALFVGVTGGTLVYRWRQGAL